VFLSKKLMELPLKIETKTVLQPSLPWPLEQKESRILEGFQSHSQHRPMIVFECTPLKTKCPFSIGNSSSNGGFFIVMLILGGVV